VLISPEGSRPILASWYDRQGPAADVLRVGELLDPTAGPGEVRVRVTVSGVNPCDTKKRRGWLDSSMPFPRVIPHSDAAGIVDAVGQGVDERQIGQRVWCRNGPQWTSKDPH
jgi:NADPH2:quinone reductase